MITILLLSGGVSSILCGFGHSPLLAQIISFALILGGGFLAGLGGFRGNVTMPILGATMLLLGIVIMEYSAAGVPI